MNKKSLLQNQLNKKTDYSLQMHTGTKKYIFGRHVLRFDGAETDLFGQNDLRYIWRIKGEAIKPENTTITVKYGSGSIMLSEVFCCWRDW